MAITSLTPYSGQTPNKATQTKEEFADNIYATHLFYDNTFVSEMNTTIGDLNTDISILNEQITFNNYKGDWLVGSTYGLGEAVSNGGFYYLSKVVGNSGHTPPADEDSYWKKAVVVYASAGGGGSVSLTAGANIDAGAPVSVLSNGTAVETTELIGGLAIGTPVVFSSGTVTNVSSCYDTTNNRLVVFYYDSVGANSYGVVGTITGSTISWGTPVSFLAGQANNIYCEFDSVNNKTIVAYTDTLNTNQSTLRVGTVSGTSISFGTATASADSNSVMGILYDVTQAKIIIIARFSTNPPKGYVCTVSGTTITWGTGVSIGTSSDGVTGCIYIGSSKHVVITTSGSNGLNYVYGTVSGTTITYGTSVNIVPTIATHVVQPKVAVNLINAKILISYGDNTNSKLKLIAGTIGASSITFGTAIDLELAATYVWDVVYNVNDLKYYIAHRQATTNYGKLTEVTISGTSITVETSVLYLSSTSTYADLMYNPVTFQSWLSYPDGSSTSDGKSVAILGSQTFEENFIGFSANTTFTGNACTVNVAGSTNSSQIGLTVGQRYYIALDGTLTTVSTAPNVYAGIAISATEILVKG